ncbi:MAG: IS200/IS605 family transposase [Candidatus Micrarchaeota archaeon]
MEKSTTSAKYNINYHIVWCPKYRRKMLVGKIATDLQNIFETICKVKEWEILELKIMPDYLHLFISTPPYESPIGIVKVLKGISAKQLFKQNPDLKFNFKKGHLWSPSYYIGTTGHVSAETIMHYIQEQETKTTKTPNSSSNSKSEVSFG